jgi:hypothetical protein
METTNLFGSIPNADPLGLFVDGQPRGQEIVGFLNLKNKEVAKAADVPVGSVRYDLKMPDILRDWLIQVGTAITLVAEFLKNKNKTGLWFRTPNPLLGNLPPIDMIRMGRVRKLLTVIQTAIDENTR